jgi:VWFA-related protein
MNWRRTSYLAVPAALALLGRAAAQSIAPDEMHARTVPYLPPPPVTLRTETTEVQVPVVVRDGQRRAVAGLTRDDFAIYASGKKQVITAFSVENFTPRSDVIGGANRAAPAATSGDAAGLQRQTRPRFVALCFDDLHLDSASLKPVKDAAERFVKTSLGPGDRVAVVTTAESQNTDFTADVPKLIERIAKVSAHPRSSDDSVGECPRIAPYEAYLIANHLDRQVVDAKRAECGACKGDPRQPCPEGEITSLAEWTWMHVRSNSQNTLGTIESLVDAMARFPGQRMILLTSAGFLTENLEMEVRQLLEKARHAEVVINTLDARQLYTVIPGGDASVSQAGQIPLQFQPVTTKAQSVQEMAKDGAMTDLASGSGGAFFHNSNDLGQGFRVLGMAPETLYILSFAPTGALASGGFHSMKVQLAAGKRYSVQARQGYTALTANASAPAPALSKLDTEVMATDTVADLPVGFTWEQKAGTSGITMVAHLDVGHLHFQTAQARRRQRLTIVGVLLDSRGNFVTGKRSDFELNLTEATFAQLAKTSFTASMTLEAPPGNYSVRGLAQDSLEGKLAAAGGTVQVR